MFIMFRMISRHFKEAFQGIFRHFAMAVSSASAVTFTLVLVSLLTLIVGNISQITKNIEESIAIYATISEEVNEDEIPSLQRQLEKIEGIISVEYSDKDAELDRWIASQGENGEYYESYREDNPLPRAFLIRVASGYSLTAINDRIRQVHGMQDSEFGGVTTENFMKILAGVRRIGYLIIAALTILAIFMISNTIKITIYNRNKEISIMRQVGASNSYIRQPFVIEGMFIGIMGAIISVIVTIVSYRYVYQEMGGKLLSNVLSLLPVNPFAYQVSAFLVLIGIVVGLIGSFLSVNKYLRWRR